MHKYRMPPHMLKIHQNTRTQQGYNTSRVNSPKIQPTSNHFSQIDTTTPLKQQQQCFTPQEWKSKTTRTLVVTNKKIDSEEKLRNKVNYLIK